MHIHSPETDNCPSWISGRERMTIENISWSISTKERCRPRRGLNPGPPGLQSDGPSSGATEAGEIMRYWDNETVRWDYVRQCEIMYLWECAPRENRSTYTFPESDHNFFWAIFGLLRLHVFFWLIARTLIRLHSCSGWSVFSSGWQQGHWSDCIVVPVDLCFLLADSKDTDQTA